MAIMTTKQMWEAIKEYFGDGHVPGSAPLRYNMHICEMRSMSKTLNDDAFCYGVELDEAAMPLFSVHGDTCAPPCTCFKMADVIKHVDEWLDANDADGKEQGNDAGDYVITSGKNDTDPDVVSLYIMRDTLSWWVHWGGKLRPGDYWKQVYVAFAAICDDIELSPAAFLSGTYRFLGHTWDDCRAGLLGEGMSVDEVLFVEMCLWRQMLTQYFEKVVPTLYPLLKANTTLMTQYRVHTGNTLGCAALILAAEGVAPAGGGVGDNALEAASIAQCLSMDMAKEALGILQGEKTETVAGNRAQLKRELRWVYVRCIEYLDTDGEQNAFLLKRFSSAGLHYVPMMDRYLERVRGNIRFPISPEQSRILEKFINRPFVSPSLNGGSRLVTEVKEKVEKGNGLNGFSSGVVMA